MKALNRLTVVIFTLCLIVFSVLAPVSIIITRDTYYINQFKKSGAYPESGNVTVRYINGNPSLSASFTKEQIEELVAHMTDYFGHKKDSYTYKMDNVLINGTLQNGVEIFSSEAASHMDDVRELFDTVRISTVICGIILAAGGLYMLRKKDSVRKEIYKWSLGTVIAFFATAVGFLLFCLIKTAAAGEVSSSAYFEQLWTYMHHLFFPFSADKFSGSFFNDTTTQLLSLQFFLNTVVTVFINIIALTAAWLLSAKLIFKR